MLWVFCLSLRLTVRQLGNYSISLISFRTTSTFRTTPKIDETEFKRPFFLIFLFLGEIDKAPQLRSLVENTTLSGNIVMLNYKHDIIRCLTFPDRVAGATPTVAHVSWCFSHRSWVSGEEF